MKNLITLTNQELLFINGGLNDGGFWYDVAYAIGSAAHGAYNAWLNTPMPTTSTYMP